MTRPELAFCSMDLVHFVNPHLRKLVVTSPHHASIPTRVVRREQRTQNTHSKVTEKQTLDPVTAMKWLKPLKVRSTIGQAAQGLGAK
jgi:hypothetical protein